VKSLDSNPISERKLISICDSPVTSFVNSGVPLTVTVIGDSKTD